jgi:hypothetical protein
MVLEDSMKIRSWVVAFAGAAVLTLGGVMAPATAIASSKASSLCPDYEGTYRIQNDASLYYLTNKGYKTQMQTTGSASTFSVYECSANHLQFQVSGANDLCIEYDGSTGGIVTDTCYSTRGSQQWDVQLGGNNELMENPSASYCAAWASSVHTGAKVYCSISPEPNQEWKVYAHAA